MPCPSIINGWANIAKYVQKWMDQIQPGLDATSRLFSELPGEPFGLELENFNFGLHIPH